MKTKCSRCKKKTDDYIINSTDFKPVCKSCLNKGEKAIVKCFTELFKEENNEQN